MYRNQERDTWASRVHRCPTSLNKLDPVRRWLKPLEVRLARVISADRNAEFASGAVRGYQHIDPSRCAPCEHAIEPHLT